MGKSEAYVILEIEQSHMSFKSSFSKTPFVFLNVVGVAIGQLGRTDRRDEVY
jgi:hypothetical protein